MAQPRETGNPPVTGNNLITDLLGSPLSPDWTVEGLAEQLLGAIAAQRCEEAQEFVLDAGVTADRQVRRLLRPLLACLATKSAAEAGGSASLYGGHVAFKRPGPDGPVWIVGQFENRPGSVRIMLRRCTAPPPGGHCETVTGDGTPTDGRVKLEDSRLGPDVFPRPSER